RLPARRPLDLLRLFPLRRDMGGKGKFPGRVANLVIGIALVQAQVLFLVGGRCRPLDRDALQGLFDQFHVGAVGAVDGQTDRDAVALDQQTALDPLLGAVGGVFPCLFPPQGVPWSCTRPCSATPSRCPRSSRIRSTRSSRAPGTRRLGPTAGSGRGRWSPGRTWWRQGPSTGSRCGGRRGWPPDR